MIVLHKCVPTKNIFRICRFDLEFFVDADLLGNGSTDEKVKMVISTGRIRAKMSEEVLGPYPTRMLEALLLETRPVIKAKIKRGYAIAVAKGLLSEHFHDELALVPKVKPWSLAAHYEASLESRRASQRAEQEKAYLKQLQKQGQNLLPVDVEERKPRHAINPSLLGNYQPTTKKGPTPRSRQYEEYIAGLGQMRLFSGEDNFDE
jgi:hypothetical protein